MKYFLCFPGLVPTYFIIHASDSAIELPVISLSQDFRIFLQMFEQTMFLKIQPESPLTENNIACK